MQNTFVLLDGIFLFLAAQRVPVLGARLRATLSRSHTVPKVLIVVWKAVLSDENKFETATADPLKGNMSVIGAHVSGRRYFPSPRHPLPGFGTMPR